MNKHTSSVSLIDGHIEDKTEAEVIKALECLKGVEVECIGCAYQKCGYPMCREEVALDALDLINRQQAEIERLKALDIQVEVSKKLEAEIKSEAIKEFAEKFKKKAGSIVTSCQGYEIYETKQYQISAVNFDNLVKEMTEVSE